MENVSPDNIAMDDRDFQPMAKYHARLLLLLVSGVFLVYFASTISQELCQRPSGVNGYTWDPAEVKEGAITIRFLGAMVFAAGLVERIVFAVRALRTQESTATTQVP